MSSTFLLKFLNFVLFMCWLVIGTSNKLSYSMEIVKIFTWTWTLFQKRTWFRSEFLISSRCLLKCGLKRSNNGMLKLGDWQSLCRHCSWHENMMKYVGKVWTRLIFIIVYNVFIQLFCINMNDSFVLDQSWSGATYMYGLRCFIQI